MAKAKAAGNKGVWREAVSGKNGLLSISLHSSNHTGEALAAMVDWVNIKTGFGTIVVGLSDTLNRHNYRITENIDEAEAHIRARLEGERWLAANARILDSLRSDLNVRVVRWDDWLFGQSEKVARYRKQFEDAYDRDPAFRATIDEGVTGNFGRRFPGGSEALRERHAQLSKAYLIEELAVYSVIYETYPSTKLYPGKELPCFDIVRAGKVEGVPESIERNSQHVRLALHGLDRSPAQSLPVELRAMGRGGQRAAIS